MATSAPEVAPLLNRGRSLNTLPAGPNKGMNPVALMLLAVVVLLLMIGIGKSLFKPAATNDVIKVVGAAADLPAGCKLSFTSLHYIEMPKKYYSPDMVTSNELVVGRVTKLFVPAGEPITNDSLLPGKGTLSSTFETNERAMTLKLDDEALIDHNVFPNDCVDVLCTSTKDGKKFTKTICQQVRVLMSTTKDATVGNRVRSNDQNRITLAVTPEQGELLAEAVEVGKVRLVLRSKLSRVSSHLGGVSEEDLLPARALAAVAKATKPLTNALNHNQFNPFQFLNPPAAPKLPLPQASAPPPNPIEWIVEVFSGAKKESYAFPNPGR